MANDEQLAILRKGVRVWNEWRKEHRRTPVDLQRADLYAANLIEANLIDADLGEANLSEAYLTGTKLRGAHLAGADLCGTYLAGADLTGADLYKANLTEANLMTAELNGASLWRANLWRAHLSRSKLDSTSLAEAALYYTAFNLTSLKSAKGLETCAHQGPSELGYHTLMASGPLPEAFLRGCGLSEDFIRYLPSLLSQPFEFYSCFISYSHADKNFARRLHDALQGRGIRCWLDEHQLLPGDLVHRAVDEGIRLWDKVLLCASEASLTSWWVDKEIRKALAKEEQLWKERNQEVLSLIPLNLDGYMFQKTWVDWKKEHLTSRLAADFTGWKNDDDKFNAQLERVIKALRADPRARERPPEAKI
jgi:uncharacterized protein YjbI with pentapeptide repeats